jgi:predicted nucleic acid-binding protein
MGASLTFLTDPKALLVADASTVINLNATGCAREVIQALPNALVIVDVVPEELEAGRHRRRQDADLLNDLVVAHLIEIVRLDDRAEQHFEQLVVGPAAMTLDDGEAATIAHAVSQKGIALIDERKANRICAERFPNLRVGCTVDIFTHPKVQHDLGKQRLADAVFNALYHGRMRVFPKHVEWVIELIGVDRAGLCTSIPRSARLGGAISSERADIR